MARRVAEWQRLFERPVGPLLDELRAIYGDEPVLLDERAAHMRRLLDAPASVLGTDRPVEIARAPARINLMGRHIDHQGGPCNLMAINREILVAAAARDDRTVTVASAEPERFPGRQFHVGERASALRHAEWRACVDDPALRRAVDERRGDWALCVEAIVLRLQHAHPKRPLCGMDLVVSGDIPMAAGLSSSSALVVAVAEAAVSLNGLRLEPPRFVELCGEGEWYVGTRGGAADHAAMKLGERGRVVRVGFFPFELLSSEPWPPVWNLVVCFSGLEARKSAGARDLYNRKVTAYHIGRELLKRHFSKAAAHVEHLRDFVVGERAPDRAALRAAVSELPERVSRAETLQLLGDEAVARLAPFFETHAAPEGYSVRGVVLFGLAEIARSVQFLDVLRRGDARAFGKLMNVSHDGDRVVVHDDRRAARAWSAPLDAPVARETPLEREPGAYGCSVPEIDLMVDIVRRIPGVHGAQISGAGLGGCVMALAEAEAAAEVERRLIGQYYRPRDLRPVVFQCVPVGGSGLFGG